MSDLISREAALKKMRNVLSNTSFIGMRSGMTYLTNCFNALLNAVKNAPAVDTEGKTMEQKWISVEERLPETDDPVLCYYLGKDGKHHYSVGYHERYGSYAEAWYVEIECNCAGYGCERVTHWMPLPEPPKMDGGM